MKSNEYLDYEKSLYDLIFEQGKVFWKNDDFIKVLDPYEVKASQYASYKIKAFVDVSDIPDIEQRVEHLYKLYTQFREGKPGVLKREYPKRFPEFFKEEIESALIRTNPAISSVKAKRLANWIDVGAETDLLVKRLKEGNIPFTTRTKGIDDFNVIIPKSYFIETFGEEAQVRRKTGVSYKVSFLTPDGSFTTSTGFFLFKGHFPVTIANAPLKKRAKGEYLKIDALPGFEIGEV